MTKRWPQVTEGFVTLVDGVQMGNDYLQIIAPDEVESIDIVMEGMKLGFLNKGVIVINTKRKNSNHNYSKDAVAGITTFNLKGYAKIREFYVPKYNVKLSKPDLRDVVYWNPNIVPYDKGKTMVDFRNADSSGTYSVVIEGITVDGRIGRNLFRYIV